MELLIDHGSLLVVVNESGTLFFSMTIEYQCHDWGVMFNRQFNLLGVCFENTTLALSSWFTKLYSSTSIEHVW